jgi:hypothetical protein
MGQIYTSPDPIKTPPTLEAKGVEVIRRDHTQLIKNVMYTTTYLISIWQLYQQSILNNEYIPPKFIGNSEKIEPRPQNVFLFNYSTRNRYSIDMMEQYYGGSNVIRTQSEESVVIVKANKPKGVTSDNDTEIGTKQTNFHVPLHLQVSNLRPDCSRSNNEDPIHTTAFGLSPLSLDTILFAHIIVPIYLQSWLTFVRYSSLLPTNLFVYHKETRFGNYSPNVTPSCGIYTISRRSLSNSQYIPVWGERVSFVITNCNQNPKNQTAILGAGPSERGHEQRNYLDTPNPPLLDLSALPLSITPLPTHRELLSKRVVAKNYPNIPLSRQTDRGMLISDFILGKFTHLHSNLTILNNSGRSTELPTLDISYYVHNTILIPLHRQFVLMPTNRIHQHEFFHHFYTNPTTLLTHHPSHRLYSHAYVSKLKAHCKPYEYSSALPPRPTTDSPLLFDIEDIFKDGLIWDIATVFQVMIVLSMVRVGEVFGKGKFEGSKLPQYENLLNSIQTLHKPYTSTIPAPIFDQTYQSYPTNSIGIKDEHLKDNIDFLLTTVQPLISKDPGIFKCPYHYEAFSPECGEYAKFYTPVIHTFNNCANNKTNFDDNSMESKLIKKIDCVCGYCIGEMVPVLLRPILLSTLIATISIKKAFIFLLPLLQHSSPRMNINVISRPRNCQDDEENTKITPIELPEENIKSDGINSESAALKPSPNDDFPASASNIAINIANEQVRSFQQKCKSCISNCLGKNAAKVDKQKAKSNNQALKDENEDLSSISGQIVQEAGMFGEYDRVIDIEDLFLKDQNPSNPYFSQGEDSKPTKSKFPPCHNYECSVYEEREFWSLVQSSKR